MEEEDKEGVEKKEKKTQIEENREKKEEKKKKCTHCSWSSCKYLPLPQQDLLGVHVLVDYDDAVGAHHQRVRRPVFPLQVFEEHMRSVRAPQTQQAADEREGWEAGGLPGAMRQYPEIQLQQQQSQRHGKQHTQTQEPSHVHRNGTREQGLIQRRPSREELCRKALSGCGAAHLCSSFNAKSLTRRV